jgi:hypothetical protein
MKVAMRALLGLFFDDGSLALVILGVLVATSLSGHMGFIGNRGAMVLLVAGTVAALIENVVRTALASRTKN